METLIKSLSFSCLRTVQVMYIRVLVEPKTLTPSILIGNSDVRTLPPLTIRAWQSYFVSTVVDNVVSF